MVVNFNEKIILIIVFIIDMSGISCIIDDDKGFLIGIIFNKIYFSYLSKSWFIKINGFDGFFWEMMFEKSF